MNTSVSFPIAMLLKEKGFNENGYLQEVWLGNKYEWRGKGKNKKSVEIPVFGLGSSSVLPTIADVLMWLYEKHGIWIYADSHEFGKWCYYYRFNRPNELYPRITENGQFSLEDYNSPTEAYEAAISYTLNNLI